ncbi:MAG: SRPBCC family protein [Dysgonamonadaceae bacterium]|jgi:carbon monoxide dehydrogenase subunit G|nr:SRPBCC family protein [Dysgonamonadaceae bacterium]
MSEFISEIKTIPFSQEKVYDVLSNMSNLEKIQNRIPEDKITNFSFDTDSCSFSVNPVGKVRFSIVERDPPKTIKLTADQSPVAITMWIQLKESQENETKMKLTVQADLNPFLKPMLSKPLQDGINKVADVLATIPYDQL